jgi:6-phosphogluconate dehydrogenase
VRCGIVGLGRMGRSLAGLAVDRGHEVVGFDPDAGARRAAETVGVETVATLEGLPARLPTTRVILLWVPHGAPVDDSINVLRGRLTVGDVLADCGNSHWQDSRRRHDDLAADGLRYLDVGTSGGVSEALRWRGAAFMVGGPRPAYDVVRPLFEDLAVDEEAVLYAGPSPAGHFVKLVHNAIEFGMIQAIAEGVELLLGFDEELDLPRVFAHWNHGTVIRSWLVELMGNALASGAISADADLGPDLAALSTSVADTGEVKWVLRWALERDIPTPVAATAQQMLMAYRDLDWPAAKSVALLRNQYGGHPIHSADETRR